jgi:hypothetical protein
MKHLIVFLFIIFSLNSLAQSKNYAGNYEFKLEADNAKFVQNLSLNPDGTFTFRSYEYHDAGIPKEINKYAKGQWKQDKKSIYFSAKTSDFDEKYTLDFNNSKARFETKSPRDKSDRDIKTSIRFYDSEIFWMKGKTLYHVND